MPSLDALSDADYLSVDKSEGIKVCDSVLSPLSERFVPCSQLSGKIKVEYNILVPSLRHSSVAGSHCASSIQSRHH